MARVPYADVQAPAVSALVDRIVAERGSVLHLYQMLLQSPPLAEGWLTFLTAVRRKFSLPGDVRELVIMRVAILNGAPYEAEQHAPIARAEGVAEEKLQQIGDWQQSLLFTTRERALLALTDASTRHVHVEAPVFEEARRHFSDREVVELVATIAAYNMVSRFLEALDIDSADTR